MKNFKLTPKKIFVVLGIIILIEVIYAIRILTAPLPSSPQAPQVQNLPQIPGKITLFNPGTPLKKGETFPVAVNIDTGSYSIGGADVIIKFDPKAIEATPGALVKGKIFDEYPLLSVDSKKGLISISGISASNKVFTGKETFALITLKPKIAGQTSLTVDFAKGSTVDSNLIDVISSEDILENVDNLELLVQ